MSTNHVEARKTPQPPRVLSTVDTAPARDSLTGLYTQDFFCVQIDELIRQRAFLGSDLILSLLQLENFYEIRSWVGKSEANLLLCKFARLLEKITPQNSLLCCCRNNEFALLLINEGSGKAVAIGEQIRHATQKVLGHAIPPQLKFCFGIAHASLDAMTPSAEIVFAHARYRLSLRQRQRNTQQADAGLQDQPDTPALLARIQRTVQHGHFRLSYQALAGFLDRHLQHYELRLQIVEAQGILSAARFIDTAVQFALGETLDRWVLDQALLVLQEDAGRQSRLIVNLTQNSLVSSTFIPWLEVRLGEKSAMASRLILQLSEIDILIAQHHIALFCQHLKRLDLQLAVAHFGCTPNPLRYLSLLQAQYVKLDPSLLERLASDSEQLVELLELVGALHERGFKVIAPGIEKPAVLPELWKARIDYVQGKCVHPPSGTRDFTFVPEIALAQG